MGYDVIYSLLEKEEFDILLNNEGFDISDAVMPSGLVLAYSDRRNDLRKAMAALYVTFADAYNIITPFVYPALADGTRVFEYINKVRKDFRLGKFELS